MLTSAFYYKYYHKYLEELSKAVLMNIRQKQIFRKEKSDEYWTSAYDCRLSASYRQVIILLKFLNIVKY